MSSKYDVRLLGSDRCGTEIMSVRFSRPEGFSFNSGQWLILELSGGVTRLAETFTICSAPSDDYLEVTTRLSGSEYKNALLRLRRGDHAAVTGPGGRFALPADAKSVAFLVGGVGITPVRSMLRDASVHGRQFDDALLLYGNRDESCVPFLAEFEAMAGSGVRTVLCYEHPPAGWAGDAGFITAEVVGRHLHPDQQKRQFIVAGPPAMVDAMEQVLDDLAVPVDNRIVERFGPKSGLSREVAEPPPTG